MLMPMLIGAGVGAVGGAVTGTNPLKTALLGAALGTGYGALGGGAAAGAGATAGATAAGGAAIPTTAAEFEAAMGLPSSALIEAGAPFMTTMPTGAAMGLTAGSAGNLVNPSYFIGAGTPIETYTGGEGLLSNAVGSLKNKIPDYITPQNLMGVSDIVSKYQTKPLQVSGSGGGIIKNQFTPNGSQLSTGDLLSRKKSNPFLLG